MGVGRLFSSLARRSYNVSPLPLLSSIIKDNSDAGKISSRTNYYEQDETKSEDDGTNLSLMDLGQRQTRNCRRRMNIISTIGIILSLIVAYLTLFGGFSGADSPKCQSVYMYPSYARIDGFDSRFTPLAQKYHLYLYREQGLDTEPMEDGSIQLDGIPVLFIPGNAGSFKQVRSIAATCAELYFTSEERIKNPRKKNLDFFAADFNEDFTAFHGRTMLDQAEYLNDAIKYILSLYKESASSVGLMPTSIIILGHSMGGVVARILPTLQNHVSGSIQSIITLSSPHAVSPVTFDGDILKIYQQTNDFWRTQFQDRNSFMSKNVSLISLTGGILDSMLPADYTAIEDIVPLENGFTSFSTEIPNVWTPIDHLAIVWCNQLREVIAKLLLETVDSNSTGGVLPLIERMGISRRVLLSGLEEYTLQDFNLANPQHHFKIYESKEFEDAEIKNPGETFMISPGNVDVSARYTKFILPEEDPLNIFYFLTSMPSTSMHFCKEGKFIDEKKGSILECVDAQPDLLHIPASLEYTNFPGDSSMDGNSEPFKFLKLDGRIFSHYDFVLLKSPNMVEITNEDFMIAGTTLGINMTISNKTPLDVALYNYEIELRSQFPWHEVVFPQLWESLIAYQIHVDIDPKDSGDHIFQPFIRQWNSDPPETKWHVNVARSNPNIFMHNVAPFIPLEETHDKSLRLTVFQPPNSDLRLKMKVNWKMTLQMLFLRYRLTFLALPISVVSITMAYQFFWYIKTDNFMNFQDALSLIFYKYWPLITLTLIILSPVVNLDIVQKLLFALDPIGFNRPLLSENVSMRTNIYFLGIRNKFMMGLGLFFILMTIGILVFIYQLSRLLDQIIHTLKKIKLLPLPKSKNKPESQLLGLSRLISSSILILAVIFYIPYQLAAAICLVIQIGTFIRINYIFGKTNNREYINLKNYNFCVFLLLAFIVAVDSPIIIVFLHNVAIKWETPFRSHHNFMAVAPMILLVGMNSRLNIPQYSRFDGAIIIGLLSYMGFFSLIYGTRNLYWTHHLCNITCAWLLYGMNLIKGHA